MKPYMDGNWYLGSQSERHRDRNTSRQGCHNRCLFDANYASLTCLMSYHLSPIVSGIIDVIVQISLYRSKCQIYIQLQCDGTCGAVRMCVVVECERGAQTGVVCQLLSQSDGCCQIVGQ